MEIINKLKIELKSKNFNSIKGELKIKNYIFGWDFEKSINNAQKNINGNRNNQSFNLNKAIDNLIYNIIHYSYLNSFVEKEENGVFYKKINILETLENNYLKAEKQRLKKETEYIKDREKEKEKEAIKNKKITNSKNFIEDFYFFYSDSRENLKNLGNVLTNSCFLNNFVIAIVDEKNIVVSCYETDDKDEKLEVIDITTYINNQKLFDYILYKFE